jgi:uncharacterized protein (TIGR02147 family)
MKPLTAYTDYRTYLKDVLEDRKQRGLPCSNRWFAQRAGMQSTSWLTLLLQGKKGLSKVSAAKLSKILGHSALQCRYFEALVEFNQAKTAGTREIHFLKVQEMARLRDPQLIEQLQYGFYSAWYHTAIRSWLGMYPFQGDFESLAASLRPRITAQEAQKSVGLLLDLGLIVETSEGRMQLAASGITTGRKTSALQIDLFHHQTLGLAMEAMDRFPKPDREFSTMTVGIAAEMLPMVKDILAEARKRIAELAEASEMANRVYQVNFQVFPMSVSAISGNSK